MAASTVAARSAAEMPVARPRPSLRSARRTRSRTASVFCVDHQRDLELVEPLAGHRQADQPAAVRRHEVDRLGRHLLGGDRQVALVLAILVVDDDDHLAARGIASMASSIGANGPDAFARPLAILMLRLSSHCLDCPAISLASSAARTTYLPTMSHSRLTRSPARAVAQVRVRPRERNDLHVELSLAEPGDRQADAVDRNRALARSDTAPAPAGNSTVSQWNSASGRIVLDRRRSRRRAPARNARRTGRRRAAAVRDSPAAALERPERRHARGLRSDVGVHLPAVDQR